MLETKNTGHDSAVGNETWQRRIEPPEGLSRAAFSVTVHASGSEYGHFVSSPWNFTQWCCFHVHRPERSEWKLLGFARLKSRNHVSANRNSLSSSTNRSVSRYSLVQYRSDGGRSPASLCNGGGRGGGIFALCLAVHRQLRRLPRRAKRGLPSTKRLCIGGMPQSREMKNKKKTVDLRERAPMN